MNGLDSPLVPWLLLAVQPLGLLSAFAARLSEGSPRQGISQRMFFGALFLVGMASIVALAVGPGCWLACSTSLAVMVSTAICDFRGGREASTW